MAVNIMCLVAALGFFPSVVSASGGSTPRSGYADGKGSGYVFKPTTKQSGVDDGRKDLVYDWSDNRPQKNIAQNNRKSFRGPEKMNPEGLPESKISWKALAGTSWSNTYTSPVCEGSSQTISLGATNLNTSNAHIEYWNGSGWTSGTSLNTGSLSQGGYTFFARIIDNWGVVQLGPSAFTIQVKPGVTMGTTAASPSTVCSGSQVNLSTSATSSGVTVLMAGGLASNDVTGWTFTHVNTYSSDSYWYTGLPSGYTYSETFTPGYPVFAMTNADIGGSDSYTDEIIGSPAVNTTGFSTLNLTFNQYYRSLGTAYVDVSTNNSTWTTVATYTTDQGSASNFAATTINLNSYVGYATLYVRFHYVSTWGWYWCITNVGISGTKSQTCTYNWSSSPAGFSSTSQNPTANPTTSTTYNVTASNGTCSNTGSTGLVTVNPPQAITLTSGNNSQTRCINVAIANIVYSLNSSVTGATVSGLPTGVTGTYSAGQFTISGTPTVAGTFNYTVTTSGICNAATATGTLTVIDNSHISLSSAAGTNVQTACATIPITNITYAVTGSATGATVAGLPPGITGSYSSGTYTISGSSGSVGTYNYTVTTTGGGCVAATATGVITIGQNQSIAWNSGSGSPNTQDLCINTAITPITYSIGGSGTGASVTGLPAGVTGSYNSGTFTISGVPTVSGTFNFTVTTSGSCLPASVTGVIKVRPNASITLVSGNPNPPGYCVNTTLSPNIVFHVDSNVTAATTTGLPPGVVSWYIVNSNELVIFGTPTSAAGSPYNYTATVSGTCAQTTYTGTMVVYAAPAITTQPTNPAATCSGFGSVSVSVGATGYNLTYQWQKWNGSSWVSISNGAGAAGGAGTVSGATSPTLLINSPTTADAGQYHVVVSGQCSVAPNSPVTSNSVTITISPCATTICAGYPVSATYSPGFNGDGSATDQYQYSINGGLTWSGWSSTPPTSINTTGGVTSVQIQMYRTGGSYCSASSVLTETPWLIAPPPTAPTLASANPANGSYICSGFNTGTVTGNPGSGGSTGAVDEYMVIIDGGAPMTYLSGSPINTTGAMTSVVIMARRTAGLYGCSNTPWSTLCTWYITPPPVATFSYPATPYCQNASNPLPAFSGGGIAGTFSSTPGLVFVNTSTGQVNLAASTPGTYTVTNTVTGSCTTVSATSTITVTGVPTANISYPGSPYCTSISTSQPVTLTGTYAFSGGVFSSAPAGLSINASSGAINPSSSTAGTYTVSYAIPGGSGCAAPAPVQTTVVITAAPTASISYAGSPFCTSTSTSQSVTLNGSGAYTGGTFTSSGGLSLNVTNGSILPNFSSAGTYVVTYTSPAIGGCSAVTANTNVTVTALPTAAITYAGSPFCSSTGTLQSVTLAGTGAYPGGTFGSSPAGLDINATSGAVRPSTSTPGIYTVTYTTPAGGGCGAYAAANTTLTITAQPVAGFSYTGSPYCSNSLNPFPTYSGGGVAGTFSSSAGLVFVSNATGQVNLSASTAGSYTVTNTIAASGGCPLTSANSSITVSPAPSATISYAGSPYCESLSGPQSVTLSGTSGGSFSSAPAGLYINSVNGNILPSNSSPASYTVTYTIPAANGCAVFSCTAPVVVSPQPVAGTATVNDPTICAGSSVILTLTGNNGNIQWQESPNGVSGWVHVTGGTGDLSPVYTSEAIAANTYYQAVVSLPGCASVNSNVIPVSVTTPSTASLAAADYLWAGGISNEWSNPSNWLVFNGASSFSIAAAAPTVSNDVRIRDLGSCNINAASTLLNSDNYCHDIIIESSLTMGAASTLHVDGDYSNLGTFNAGTSLVVFEGNAPQNVIAGGDPFYNIGIDNNAPGNADINLSDTMTVTNSGYFNNGIVYYTANGMMKFTEGATCPNGGSYTSFVDDPVIKSGTNAFLFPTGDVVGSEVIWAPVGIAAAANSTIKAQYFFDLPHDGSGNVINNWNHNMMCDLAELDHVSGLEYWELSTNNAKPAVTLFWKDAERSQITYLPDLCVAHYEDCDGNGPGSVIKWASKGGSPNAVGTVGPGGSGYVTSTIPFLSYSPVTFGTKSSINPVPVTLLSFSASCESGKVLVEWSTASEINNEFFTIERSPDAYQWEHVADVPGSGNSNYVRHYSIEDPEPVDESPYYRLIQHDFNGHKEIFGPVHADCQENDHRPSVTCYPNPVTSELTIEWKNMIPETSEITVYNMLGEKVIALSPVMEKTSQKIVIDMEHLPEGIYTVKFQSDHFSQTDKIIRSKN